MQLTQIQKRVCVWSCCPDYPPSESCVDAAVGEVSLVTDTLSTLCVCTCIWKGVCKYRIVSERLGAWVRESVKVCVCLCVWDELDRCGWLRDHRVFSEAVFCSGCGHHWPSSPDARPRLNDKTTEQTDTTPFLRPLPLPLPTLNPSDPASLHPSPFASLQIICGWMQPPVTHYVCESVCLSVCIYICNCAGVCVCVFVSFLCAHQWGLQRETWLTVILWCINYQKVLWYYGNRMF